MYKHVINTIINEILVTVLQQKNEKCYKRNKSVQENKFQ